MNDLVTIMLNYAFDHQIGFMNAPLKDHSPAFSISEERLIVLNSNWWRKNEVPFIIAHEIAHILNGDSHRSYYTRNTSTNLKCEKRANLRAVNIAPILNNGTDKPIRFMA